jgi:hypothetical protein
MNTFRKIYYSHTTHIEQNWVQSSNKSMVRRKGVIYHALLPQVYQGVSGPGASDSHRCLEAATFYSQLSATQSNTKSLLAILLIIHQPINVPTAGAQVFLMDYP